MIKSASSAAKESEDIRQAEQSVEAVLEKRADLQARVEDEIQAIQQEFDPQSLTLEETDITPRKSDLAVQNVSLVWLPYTVSAGAQTGAGGDSERAF